MALKGCIKKAGKALDADDRKYMQDLMAKGRPDEEVLNRLEQRIQREQAEAVALFEDQGVPVVKADSVSEETVGAVGDTAEGSGNAGDVSEESDSAEAADSGGRPRLPRGRTEAEAPPKPRDASDTSSFEFGPATTAPGQTAANALQLTRDNAEQALNKLAEGSEIIARYIKGKTGDLMLDAFTNSYIADEDVVAVQGPRTGNRLDLNTEKGLKQQTEILEHEIIHANTVGFIQKTLSDGSESPQLRDIKYLGKAVAELGSLNPARLSRETAMRLQYIVSQPNMEKAVAEFIAVMGSETDTAQELYKALGRRQGLDRPTLAQTVARFAQRVLRAITEGDLRKELDIELVNAALLRTIEAGTEFREQQYQEFRAYTQELDAFNYGPKAPEIAFRRKASFDYLNFAVSSMLNQRLERKGKKILGNLHEMMYDRFPLYTDVADKAIGIYDGSPALQQFVHTVTGEGVNKQKKADVLAKYAAVNAQRTEIINDQLSQINRLSQSLTDREKADLDIFISQTPLHDYFIQASELKTAESIEAEAELLRKELWRVNARAVRDAEQLIDWNVDGNLTGNIYNLEAKYPMTGEFGMKLRKYLALESINRVGAKKFEKLLAREELMNVIRDNSVANALSTLENEGVQQVRDSLIMDYYKEPFQIKAVSQADFRMYEFGEETGWKVLQSPTKTQLGIVYKPTIDSTDIAGAYTDTKLSSTDINVPDSMRKMNNVVATKTGYKLLLTKAQKQELGLIEEFGQGLVRSAAHSIAIQESQIIRDEILKQDTWMEVGNKRSIEKLEKIIESENVDNPWFLKLSDGAEYNKLPQSVRAKYMPVAGRASNVKGFNEEVDLVRKDISHWLLGGSAKSLFQNPHMKWAMRILKDLVSGAKIGMIVLNPVKIANDNLSNLTYLGVLGLDPKFIATNYKDIATDFADYSELQRQIFQLKVQLISRPESVKIQKRLKSLQKRLAANPIGDIGDKGFVNSLGSDLVSRSADTLSGFQADMHTALEYLLTDKSGNKNVVSHFIMELQRIGYQAEDFFSYLADIAGKANSTQLLHQELDQVAERLREIKSEEDIVNYVAQFTTSPSSEAVRFGSAMTDLTDVLAKETLYRHFVENMRMSPEDARIQVLDSFPDYKENMPLSIQQLSDVGILMFPSFWLRIQKIIYRMVRDKPVNLATEMMIQEMVGSDINTIFEANVINKANTFGGLIHMPFEPVGVGSVVPTHTF